MSQAAWLDSLSEDWVSQPRSDPSQAELSSISIPRLDTRRESLRRSVSRIPRLSHGPSKSVGNAREIGANPLNERSGNEINMLLSQRAPSKLPYNARLSSDRRHQRSVSASPAASVIRNTPQNKATARSPHEPDEETPEWRRLLQGAMAHREVKDLFTSAKTELEDIFRPPHPPEEGRVDREAVKDEGQVENGTLRSSAHPRAPYSHLSEVGDDVVGPPRNDVADAQQPTRARQMKYARNGEAAEDTRSECSTRRDQSDVDKSTHGQALATEEGSQISSTSLHAKPRQDASRAVSGKSDGANEEFSPIMIACRSSGDGNVSFSPVELPANELRERLNTLRRNQQFMVDSGDLDSRLGRRSSPARTSGGAQKSEITEEWARRGGFLKLRRGSRPDERSSRQLPPSPPMPPSTDTSEMLPESSLQASTPKQFTTIKGPRAANRGAAPNMRPRDAIPPAPHPSPEKKAPKTARASGGSPLKLFGPYDTFTNQTLLRRISDLQGDDSPSAEDASTKPAGEPSRRGVSRFGAGELDDFAFNEDYSIQPSDSSQADDKENLTPPMPRHHMFKFQLNHYTSEADDEQDGEDSLTIRRSRAKSSSWTSVRRASNASGSHASARTRTADMMATDRRLLATPKRDLSEGKRARASPTKDPTPKRRRTLHRSDVAYGLEDSPAMDSVQTRHMQMQSAMGRRRQETGPEHLHLDDVSGGPPSRPPPRQHSPTPDGKSVRKRKQRALSDMEPGAGDSGDSGHSGDSGIDHEVTARNGNAQSTHVQDFAEGGRKTSYKTQDFFHEAEKIMAMIRNKARPHQNGLASVEESEAEGSKSRNTGVAEEEKDEESFQNSTMESFLRPPSRDGPALTRKPARQQDPELVDRLKQYEEASNCSVPSKSFSNMLDAIQNMDKISESIQQSISRSSELRNTAPDQDEVISDLSNVRISRNPDAAAEATLHPSQGSSDNSPGHSVPTASSRGSDSRRLIAPDLVTHVIGDQVGDMMLDREHHVWMKVKASQPVAPEEVASGEDSEEDPFASIADLTVDTTWEQKHLALKPGPIADLDKFVQDHFGPGSPLANSSSGKGKCQSHSKENLVRIKQTLVDTALEDDEEVDQEITMHEDRGQFPSSCRHGKMMRKRTRNMTITFSSPIASIIQDTLPRPSAPKSSGGATSSLKGALQARPNRSASSIMTKPHSRNRTQGNLSTTQTTPSSPRPVSRIEERDEEGGGERTADCGLGQGQVTIHADSGMAEHDERDRDEASYNLVVTTPAASQRPSPSGATERIADNVGMFSLSHLSDFTMNQAEECHGLEVSYVVNKKDYLVTGDGSRKILSQAIRRLVEQISQVEPYEPDWNTVRALDIKGRGLASLHKLDDFCGSIVSLDASNNSISHLDGVPRKVRNLRLTDNLLSEMTAWGHLTNLQYVDISGNQTKSLYAFKDLVHLRSLRADDNQVTSLDGIKLHDSLQVLRLRNNLISDVDFDGAALQRLTELDLQGNQIASIRNVQQLPCLASLNLEGNRLQSLADMCDEALPSLRYLKLSDNKLTELDFSKLPSLRLLHADRNCLSTVTGILRARRLDSLSLREQRGERSLDPACLSHACEVRKLFLSGNLLTSFAPSVDFLNLQYLELANCGLQSLADNLGQLMPNLRTLNANFNAIDDLTALRYIPRLKKLLVAGNRVSDMSAVAHLLGDFPHLRNVDLRDNPISLGFYPPIRGTAEKGRADEGDAGAAAESGSQFALPDASREHDDAFASRLDLGTKKRRRILEILMMQRCPRLRTLDGLVVDPMRVRRRDETWRALVECGAVSEVNSASA